MGTLLDAKKPTLVIVGHWNTEILNEPGWLAKHILHVPDGQQIEFQAIVVGNQVRPGQIAPQKQILLFESLGICCSNQRLELFGRDIDQPQPIYEAIDAIAETLPHTPIKAIGTNFHFKLSEDLAAITPLFTTNEVFDALGAIKSEDRADCIELSEESLLEVEGLGKPKTALNLARGTDFQSADIRFNYHVELNNLDEIASWVGADPVSHWRRHCLSAMSEIYGQEEIETEYF